MEGIALEKEEEAGIPSMLGPPDKEVGISSMDKKVDEFNKEIQLELNSVEPVVLTTELIEEARPRIVAPPAKTTKAANQLATSTATPRAHWRTTKSVV
ncbi:MAG: hypothetical protein WDW21_03850 [Neisseriaceae bacterium]